MSETNPNIDLFEAVRMYPESHERGTCAIPVEGYHPFPVGAHNTLRPSELCALIK